MSYTLIVAALVLAVVDWVAVARDWKRVEYIAKPGVMVALLLWLWQAGGFRGQTAWFALGILFSMAGDIFLMLPRERFIPGLVAFLLAHISYLVGLTSSFPPMHVMSLLPALMVGIVGKQIYQGIAGGLKRSNQESLKLPVLVYSIAISLMLLAAVLTLVRDNEEWLPGAALMVSSGALLFFLSDTFLAWNKFVTPLRYGRLRVIITYHLGQVLIVLGAASNFLR